jgi:hypothetical protein
MAASQTRNNGLARLKKTMVARILTFVMILSSVFRVAAAHTVNLAWNASADSTVTGYKVYYGTNPGSLAASTSIDVGANLSGSVTNLGSGTYYFAATSYNSNRVESDLSNIASTNLLDAPVIISQTTNVTCGYGGTTNLSVNVNGSAPLRFQWFSNGNALSDGGNILGTTTASLTFASAIDANQGSYQVVVSNSWGATTSSLMTLTVVDPPVVASQPVGLTRTTGASGIFSVTANGAPLLNYQWLKNGAALSDGGNVLGSTTASLTVSSVSTSDAASYQCVITNGSGSATSQNAVLTVVVPAAVTGQPTSQTLNAGSLATFSVGASGTAPITYAWTKNGNPLANGGNVFGATTANLTVSGIGNADAASYAAVVSNSGGSGTSASAVLVVIAPPTFGSQPVSVTANAGSLVSFNAGVQGSQPLTYQWTRLGVAVTNSANISGATSPSMTFASVGAADAGSYKCVVTNSAGSATSSMVLLTVLLPPWITTQPGPQTVNVGGSGVFSVAVTGTAPFTYSWSKDGVALANAGNISGANTASLTVATVAHANAGNYSCVISNNVGTATSGAAVLTISDATVILAQPISQTLNSCDTLNLTVSVGGSVTPTYQWMHNGTPIPNATSSIYSVVAVTGVDAGTYSVQVTGDAVINSSNAVVTVADPIFLSQPADNCVTANTTNVFTAFACGTPNLNYQWFFIASGSSTATAISGATNGQLAVGPTTTRDVGQYFCVVSNSYNSITSRVASLGVEVAPTITAQPANQTKITGNPVTFTVAGTASSALTFQWTKNGTNMTGATDSSYTIANVQTSDAGTYRCYLGTTLCQSTVLTASTSGHLSVSRDTIQPKVTFTYPTLNARFTNSFVTRFGTVTSTAPQVVISGSVIDNSRVANLTITRIFPPWAPMKIVPTLVGSPTLERWTNSIMLVAGTNTFAAVATDASGLASTNFLNVFLRVPTTLQLGTNGAGSIMPLAPLTFGTPTNNATLEVGRNYRIQAKAGAGNMFSNWVDNTGAELSRNAMFEFRMQTNMHIAANFVTNPIVANNASGSYNGLFFETNEVRVQSAGALFNFLVRTDATFSGTLKLGGASYVLSGSFDIHGNATRHILRATKTTLTVDLHLDWSGSKLLTGAVSSPAPDEWSSPILADLAPYTAANRFSNPARYTLTVPPGAGAPAFSPGGFGYGFVTNNSLGTISFIGTLADGTPISQTVPISRQGYWPLYIPLYGNRGLIEGWMNFSSGSPGGNVSWIRPAGKLTSTYTNGFTNVTRIFGSPYTPMTPSLNPGDGALNIGSPAMTFQYAVSNNNAIVVLPGSPTNSFSGSISAPTGAISISYRPTGASANHIGRGAVLQWNNAAFGFSIENNISAPLHLH